MDHCTVAAAVHAQAKAYLARFGHEATLRDDYAILITTREADAQMRVWLTVDGVEHALTIQLPSRQADHAGISAQAAAILAESSLLLAGLSPSGQETLQSQ